MDDLKVHVLFRFSKKTGKIDTTMTALGCGLLKMWALQNTTKTKACLIVERDSGKVILATQGTESGFPKIKDKNLGNAKEYGIPISFLREECVDDRFDK